MTIVSKLAIVPAIGLAAAVVSPANIDEKPRTWADFGIPDFKNAIPFLVRYNGHHIKLGEKPTTENHYKINGFTIIEESADGIVKRVIVVRPYSERQEVYLPNSDGIEKEI